ncbi:MAG: NAD(P)H-dependent oxidoreductase [Candidatus Devosia euplotis]|nr:NAD(P)H-dependent oxidoreductase [Candidatus Devosia euplotis]
MAKALEKPAEAQLQLDYLDIGALPFYNNDLWDNTPATVTALKRQIERADGVLILMPEFNRSFPTVIKNALDWGSRPYGQNAWNGKPPAIAGATPGAVSTAAGQNHLRAILPILGFVVMG